MKKTIIILFSLILVAILIIITNQKHFITFKSDEYNIRVKYSTDYYKTKKEGTIINLKNSNGMEISLVGVKKAKTNLTIDEIKDNYETTFSVFYDNYTVETIKKETIYIDNIEAGMILSRVIKENNRTNFLTILIPMEDQEITIMISGNEKVYDKNQKSIEEFIKSIETK